MKIRFRKVTNIRSDHRSLTAAPLGVVYPNTVLEVDGIIHEGVSLKGDNRWWRDLNGWYYWAGETEALSPSAQAPDTPAISPKPPVQPAPPPLAAPEPSRPPIAATELVALPVPDEPPAKTEDVPEGEWRSLNSAPASPATTIARSIAPPDALEAFEAPADSSGQTPRATPPELLSPRAQRLNWGLETGQIPVSWWQENRLTGRGVTLAVLSTGADAEHPDLAGSPSPVFANLLDNQARGDVHGLGTQAAIVAAGKGQIAYGVAPEVSLLIGKIGATPNDISPANLIAGLEWAIAQKADIAALLVDFIELNDLEKQQMSDAIARALDANMVLLAPVGNSSERKPEDRFPAAFEGVISVGAHHSFNRRSDFSAKSYHLDLLAPGEGLNTADLQRNFGSNLKNTAIATAFTAGLVALLRQWEKQHNEQYSPSDIRAFLQDTAHYEGINKGKDTEMGFGILNPQAILARLKS